MAFRSKKRSRLEDRLRSLEKESHLIKDDMRTLSSMLKNPDDWKGKTKLKYQPKPRLVPPAPKEDPVASSKRRHIRERNAPHGELFQWHGTASDKSHAEDSELFPNVRLDKQQQAETSVGYAKGQLDKKRFTNYFAQGSFMGPVMPLKQEKNLQRNKAVFMLIVVIVVGFVVVKLLL